MIPYAQSTQMLFDYDRLARSVRMSLLDRHPAKVIWGVITDTRLEFARLIPKIPSIGKARIWQFDLETSVMVLALCRSLTKYGYSRSETIHLIYDMLEARMNRYPSILRRAYRRYHFSTFHRNWLQREADRSQMCQNPDAWVFTYLEGDGETFDFGVDIRECAIQKFFRAQCADEFTPYLCFLDQAIGERLGLGICRQGTLTGGATVCDCRWKLGAEPQGVPSILDRLPQNSLTE